MYITKRGTYPENNKAECKGCHCHFKYYNSEVKTSVSDPDISSFMGGIAVTTYLECPQCKADVILNSDFYEDSSAIMESIKLTLNKIKNIFNKKGKDENGKIENK